MGFYLQENGGKQLHLYGCINRGERTNDEEEDEEGEEDEEENLELIRLF